MYKNREANNVITKILRITINTSCNLYNLPSRKKKLNYYTQRQKQQSADIQRHLPLMNTIN